MVKKYFILALLLFNTICTFADYWLKYPKTIVAYSQNKEYMLKVYSVGTDSHHSYEYQRQVKKRIVKETFMPCYAVLYRILNSDTIEIWNKPLVNLPLPVEAIVANDGKSVITIDNWGTRGLIHTLVIYGEDGELIKDFELKDISPFPLEQYWQTISSIHWGSDVEYLDNDRVVIRFKSENDEKKERIFDIKKRAFE